MDLVRLPGEVAVDGGPGDAAHRLTVYLAGREDLHADLLPIPVGGPGAKVGARPLFVTSSGGRLHRTEVQRMLSIG